jgi:hypothetical protein
MWVRGAAIRPVPSFAVLEKASLDAIERELESDREGASVELEVAFARFERTQPQLADRISDVLGRRLDETALALGYFLSIAIWLAFDRGFGERVREVTEDALKATDIALTLEEELRADHAEEPLDLDDVIAREQPGVVAFVNEHIEAALDGARTSSGDSRDVDVDDVHLVYRAILTLILALSHAVLPEDGRAPPKIDEMMA